MKTKIYSSFVALTTISVMLLAPSAQAQVQWAKRIASTINPDDELAIGMTLDTNGNCYVTGWFDGTNDFGGVILTNNNIGGQDIFVAKYNSAGVLQWAQLAGGSTANEDAGRGIGVDTNGNVYVTGGFYGPATFGSSNFPASTNEEFFLAKYNNTGTVQWVQQSTGGSMYSPYVYGTGLTVDGAGNSYSLIYAGHSAYEGATLITFGSTNVTIPANYEDSTILVKYDETGTLQWAQLMGGTGAPGTYATKVAVDAAGNVYVRGSFTENITIGNSNLVSAVSPKNMFIAKFNNSGALTWVQQATGGDVDEGGVAVDQAGDVYVTGAFGGTPLNFGGITLTNMGTNIADAFLAKYSNSGVPQWARQAGGTNGGIQDGVIYAGFYLDVALDGQGYVYAAGSLSPNAPGSSGNAAVAKYNPAGTLQWTCSASGPPASLVASVADKVAVDLAGNCYLAGWYQETNTFGTNVLQPQGYWNYFLAKVGAPASPTLGIVLSNGVPRLSLAGAISSIFSLQCSPTLAATNTPWQTLTTLTLTNSPQFYLDTSVPSRTNRFYRAGPPAL